MKPIQILFAFALIFTSTTTQATTWDEPWQDQVIREAESFVFAKVVSNDEKKGVKIQVIKTLGGKELQGSITINNFYLLNLCSVSGGHGPEFHFDDIKECFFFIKKNSKGNYCIATPTTGFDYVIDGNVYAAYRHSYHKAIVPLEVYEKTMGAIFNHYHKQPYDKKYIHEYVNKYLSLKPSGFSKNEIDNFFAQHVALECAYHLRLTDYYAKLLPFFADTSNFHNQTSAARAMISYNTPECRQELMKIISDTTQSPFLQVICIWSLAEFKPVELKEQLIKIAKTASTKENGFGGNIMDPRVCTHVPKVKKALETLIKGL
jgi:hypothetical protein